MKTTTKLTFGAVAAFVVSLTFASDNLTVINQSPKASVMTGLATTVQDTIGNNTSFYQSRDCKDAARVYTQKKNQVIIYETMNVASAAAKNIDCKIDFEPVEVAVYSWQSFSICRLPETNTALDNSATLGMSGMHPYKKWISEFNAKNNGRLEVRLYSGSGATIKGLLSKEISWGFIATAVATKSQAQGLIKCDFNTDPTSDAFIGKTYKHALGDLRIKVVVLDNSGTSATVGALSKEEFVNYLTKSGYSYINHGMTAEQLEQFEKEYKTLQNFY